MLNCHLENGRKTSLRHVTVDGILVRENKILLVKRAPDSLVEANKYALPGGFLDRDETTSAAITREVKEETGYQSKVLALLRIIDNPARAGEDRQNVDFVYLLEPQEKVSGSDQEIKSIHWFNLNNLPPPTQFAFDHYATIQLYLKHRKQPLRLPLFG